MRFKTLSLVLALSLGTMLPALAAEATVSASQPVSLTPFASVEGITEYRLANGLRVLLAPDASKPTTTVNITYLVGSRHENYGETGMAHLLEHMVFKGTPKLPGKTIVQEFSKRGMHFNGTTWFDRTNYYETFAASDDNLDWALQMEADRMVNSFIARSDLDSEFSVVRNEMEMGENSPSSILMKQMSASAYQWHNYGKNTIGARSDVENVKIENLQAFYRAHYQPDNAVLTITGHFDPVRTLAKVTEFFAPIPKPTRVLPITYTREPVQDGAHEVTVSRVGDTQLIGVQYHISPGAHPDTALMSLLAQIMGDTPTGRLHKALVQSKIAVGVGANTFELQEPGYVMFFVELNKKQSREAARKALLSALEGIAKQPITETELQRAKTALLNNFDMTLADPVAFGVGLSEAIAAGDWRLLFLMRDRIEAATVADVQRVANNYLRESNRTLGQFVPTDKPQRAEIPVAPDVDKLVGGYKGRDAIMAGESFDPTPANVEARTQRMKLGNGLQLALLPKQNRGNTVSGVMTMRMGDEKSMFKQAMVGDLAAAMLMRGAGKLDRQQLADRLEQLKAKLSISAHGQNLTVSFETRNKQLPELLALLQTILRQPTWSAEEFAALQNEALTSIEDQMRQPEALAQQALSRHGNPYPKGDIRYSASFEEQIAELKSIKLADLKRFQQRFYGTQDAQMALVGDFDAKAAAAQLQTLFGSWTAQEKFVRVADPYIEIKPGKVQLETPDKANAAYFGGMALNMLDTAPDYPALALAGRVLGGGGLKSRLMDRLRQKEGISYGVGSWLHVGPLNNNGSLGLYAIYAPANLARVQAAIQEEVTKLVETGVTQQEIDEARSGILQEATIARTHDGSLAGSLSNQLYLKRTMAFTAEQETRLRAVTLADVNAAIRKYIDPARLVNVYAGDFAHAKQAVAK
ncbi:M16 family metallopeptidase [Chitinimonas sp. BJB300]|uniref:M16 family metallopeptidase n=1 Tax=Chitinimonas sp. BJB300 TaxID=1559339 RepID=UPI000C119704|nr:pitrilysin family protein [Chitinimonas sp. BJB300]PHV12345.1 peptidase M16 [Chitinimonas sp. BJB300]TSJ91055.1 insulinase family protein [Chitinimonas sp. BJB300]